MSDQEYEKPATKSKYADAGPLGLFGFAATTLVLSLYNVQARGITHPNVVVGMAIAFGGLAQLLAGMWEFPRGNTFAATAFSSYGAFWISYAAILLPGTGIAASYDPTTNEFASAIGIYLLSWFIITFMFFIAALRKSVAFIALFLFLFITFLLLGAGSFTANLSVTKAGGGVGIATALVAFYIGLSMLLASEAKSIVTLPLGVF